jgi:3-hydroxybutyryl-CoA dehydratase
MSPAPDIANFRFDDLREGTSAEHAYAITEACHLAMTDVFRDVSPIHVDEAAAKRAGFEARVMHGAVLNGFASHFVGCVLPGRRSLLLSMDMRYLTPSYLGDAIVIQGKVSQRVESERVVVLTLTIENRTRRHVAARARAQVRVSDGV